MQATVQVFVGVVGENPHPNFGKIGVSLGLEYFGTLNFLGRLVEFRSAVRLCGEGRATGPPESDTAAAQRSILDTKEKNMRFMMIMFPKDYENAKPGWAPDLKDMEAMGKYNEELGKAGVLLALDGLTPPSTMSARVTFKGGKSKVTDGPFTEAKEVVGGYWIIQVKSREEALEWASRIPGKDNEMVEVRRMFDLTDFDPETQKEIQKKFGDDVAAEMRQ